MAQLYAITFEGEVIAACHALKQTDYFCPECKKIVRLRGGLHRQDHFYHLEITVDCRQSRKSFEHIQAQLYILKALPQGDCHLEWRFPEIHRIADVVWPSEKLIFEIQCSPIRQEEIMARNADYARAGYEVVWILHDHRFNQKRLTAAEHWLFPLPHYFTNLSAKGIGIIYDQFSLFKQGYRHSLKPLPIDIAQPRYYKSDYKEHSLYFVGDLTDRRLSPSEEDREYLEAVKNLEEGMSGKRTFIQLLKLGLERWIFRPYRLLFQIFLERACK